jgi:predicted TIM-barrel fold metal-dependent hydrolase
VSPNDPEYSVREIEAYAGEPEMVAVAMPLPGMDPLLGDSRYDPILKAVEDSGLPLMLHSAAFVYPSFPHNTHRMASLFAMSTIGHGFSIMANMVNVVAAGAPARFPGIDWVWVEAGLAWFPYIMMRLDRQYDERRAVAPVLQKRPSEYFDRMYVGTQPIEEPDDFSKVTKIIELYDGWDTTLFASDWPHHDFDHPRKAWMIPTSDENKRKIMGENALRVFNLADPREPANAESNGAVGHAVENAAQ